MSRNPPWSEEELILALGIYEHFDDDRLSSSDERIITLSNLLSRLPIHEVIGQEFRSPDGVRRRLGYIRQIIRDGDVSDRPKYLAVVKRYHGDSDELQKEILRIKSKYGLLDVPFEVGESYSRNQIQDILDVPLEMRHGDWNTGYHRHEDDWYIFCNIGNPGRTGHDYRNRFEGERLHWYGKTNSKLSHSSIKCLLGTAGNVHVFFRTNSRGPFVFAGLAVPVSVTDKVPVEVLWSIIDPEQVSPSDVATIGRVACKPGGTIESHRCHTENLEPSEQAKDRMSPIVGDRVQGEESRHRSAEGMPYQKNPHVSMLKLIGLGQGPIYEEKAKPNQLKTIPTCAIVTLNKLVDDEAKRMVVLTGDAGHGKTHLCRRLIEDKLGLSPEKAYEVIRDSSNGAEPLGKAGGRDLYIVKDLSDFTEPVARALLEKALTFDNAVMVVCANEGKLRKVASLSDSLQIIIATLQHSYEEGELSLRPDVAVIDLNFQSVTADDDDGLFGQLLRQWIVDGRKWKKCNNCMASATCPIIWNRRMLSGDGDQVAGDKRRRGLGVLLRIVEQSGEIITVRDMLRLTAYLMTSGIDCSEVVRRHKKSPEDHDWQFEYLYFQSLFVPPLNIDDKRSLALLDILRRFDPGRVAVRRVDDVLAADTELPGLEFVPPVLRMSIFTPRSRKQARDEASRHRDTIAFLRRRDFFELETDDLRREIAGTSVGVPQAERLGFNHYDEFVYMCNSTELEGGTQLRTKIRNRVLKGLEAVQDLRRSTSQTGRFAVVDPAYGNSYGSASILAKMIQAKNVQILPQSAFWATDEKDRPELCDGVDWIDRRLVVLFKQDDTTLELDLLDFEFVLRSAEGLSCRNFYMSEIRRIMSRLAVMAEREATDSEEITVVYGNRLRTISIDDGFKIVCEDG